MVADRQTVFAAPAAHRGALLPRSGRGRPPAVGDPLVAWMATLPGLVEVTAAELRSLGLRPSPARGGVQAELPAGSLSKLLSLLRTPEQLLIEFGQADVAGVAGLGDLAQALRATGWLVGDVAPVWSIHASTRTTALAARLQRAIDDTRPPPATERPRPVVHLRLLGGAKAAVAVDPVGFPLAQRGYRLDPGPAPLRETLAAAALRLAGHQPGMTVWDPCCGSGTLAIEARLSGRPVALRPWAIVAPPPIEPTVRAGHALCGDLDAAQVARTRDHAVRAGVAVELTVLVRELAAWPPDPAIDLVATNLPWGDRLGSRAEARRLVQRWAAAVARTAPDRPAVVVVAEPQLASDTGLRDAQVVATRNGGKAVWLVVGRTPRRGSP